MKLSIIIIGDEILLGRVTDTNSGMIARAFSADGWQVASVRTVGDKADAIADAIRRALDESTLVITTGGLGPTRDDITKAVMADIFGGPMVWNDAVSANIDTIFAQRKIKLNELTRRQALVPASCRVIQNRLGTAPLMVFGKDGKTLIAMPGVPFESRGMLPEVVEDVRARYGLGGVVLHREFTVTGISESALAERLAPFEDSLPEHYKLAYLPNPGEIVLRLDADLGEDGSRGDFDTACSRLKELLADNFAADGKMLPAELLLHKLRRRGYTLATAESCTGGNIAHKITEIAGCSDVFLGSVVSYCNEVKARVLGVDPDVLATQGAVSEPVVEMMTAGACRVLGADCSVATSGIAGPGGAVPGKPVGTVWICARTPEAVRTECCFFGGDRQAVIDRATAKALTMLAELIN